VAAITRVFVSLHHPNRIETVCYSREKQHGHLDEDGQLNTPAACAL
jgi:hypothetical protein